MKAVTQHEYGSADVLRLEQVPTPSPADGQVLVRVHAAAICKGDVHLMTGKPYLVRLMFGVRRPKNLVIGQEVAGTVVALGPGVTAFRVGDAVFGQVGTGALAEYVCAPADKLAPKPARLSFEQAAAVADSAITALQALRDIGEVKAGNRVLINGASGGVGTFAVQIAKALGAQVTAVCSTRHVETVRGIGADHVIDYTSQDFAAPSEPTPSPRFDVLLDLVGNRSLADCKRVLEPTGILVSCTGSPGGNWLGPITWLLKLWAVDKGSSQSLRTFLVQIRNEDLRALAALVDAGQVTPVIERVFPFESAAEALRHVAAGHAQGKTVVAVHDSSGGASS